MVESLYWTRQGLSQGALEPRSKLHDLEVQGQKSYNQGAASLK